MSSLNKISMFIRNPILNLSKTLLVNSPTIPYSKLKFSGGEEHIKITNCNIISESEKITIATSLTSSSDVMSMLLATNAIRSINSEVKIDLFAPYIPYARQDRIMSGGEALGIKVMANLINSQSYDKVHVFDPHSSVTHALINNVNLIDYRSFCFSAFVKIRSNNCFSNGENYCIVSPDAGAEKKIYNIAKYFNSKSRIPLIDSEKIILGSKQRDVLTGEITQTRAMGNVRDKICIIFDDIIDGGATFINLAIALRRRGAKKVYLVASHGIFSKGIDVFRPIIDNIYITNSINCINDDYVTTENILYN